MVKNHHSKSPDTGENGADLKVNLPSSLTKQVMPDSIADLASPELKRSLRKMKTCPIDVKSIIYSGNKKGTGPVLQFHFDLKLYGMWEALLYVEGYEKSGDYEPGTAIRALEALR